MKNFKRTKKVVASQIKSEPTTMEKIKVTPKTSYIVDDFDFCGDSCNFLSETL